MLLNGGEEVTTKADIWSVGVILYCLIAGNFQEKGSGDISPVSITDFDNRNDNFDFSEPQWD